MSVFDTIDSMVPDPREWTGHVRALRGLCAVVGDLPAPVGALVRICGQLGDVMGEVIGFDSGDAIVMAMGSREGLLSGTPVTLEQVAPVVRVGAQQLGRVIDGLARPVDGAGPIGAARVRPLQPEPIGPMHRRLIREPLHTGVRAVDLITPLGRGQRMGVFAGPGVGKSTLLGQLARGASSDINVIALIGERGREVGEFIKETLGPQTLARSVVVVATGDESPVMRVRAAKSACAIAEHFRDEGNDVLFIMDSATRFAHAQRQIGLAVGEPPATRGYTPSVFSELACLLERAGAVDGPNGPCSITGLYTVLVEGDDMTEPVADAARGILDGHLILSRALAQRGYFPAIDVLDSISRVMREVADDEHLRARQIVLRLEARYKEIEELVRIGAYARGSDREADAALEFREMVEALLTQGSGESSSPGDARSALLALASQMHAKLDSSSRAA